MSKYQTEVSSMEFALSPDDDYPRPYSDRVSMSDEASSSTVRVNLQLVVKVDRSEAAWLQRSLADAMKYGGLSISFHREILPTGRAAK